MTLEEYINKMNLKQEYGNFMKEQEMPKIYALPDPNRSNGQLALFSTNLKVGDKVIRVTRPSSLNSELQRGAVAEITAIVRRGESKYFMVHAKDVIYEEGYTGVRMTDGSYQNVYSQIVNINYSSREYKADNFEIVKENNMSPLAIEANRPTYVREFKEDVVDGKNTRVYIGDFLGPYDNMSSAQVFASNEISTSIRKDNAYRQFAIFQEKHVARAKKPEIEFA